MKKIALITALVIGTGSVALATEFDPNLANRYPAYPAPKAQSMITRTSALAAEPSGSRRRSTARATRTRAASKPYEVPRTGSPRAGSHPEQPARPPRAAVLFLRARNSQRLGQFLPRSI